MASCALATLPAEGTGVPLVKVRITGYNALGIPVAPAVAVPAIRPALSPVFAGAAMALSSVSVATNALRLNRLKL